MLTAHLCRVKLPMIFPTFRDRRSALRLGCCVSGSFFLHQSACWHVGSPWILCSSVNETAYSAWPVTIGGGNASRSIRSRIAANNFRVIATSASWNVTYLAWRVTIAPILISFSRSVVNDQCRTGFGKASRRKKLPRL